MAGKNGTMDMLLVNQREALPTIWYWDYTAVNVRSRAE